MNRFQLFGLWFLCALATPLILFAMLLDVVFAEGRRVVAVFTAYDVAGNYAMGGNESWTFSAQIGKASYHGYTSAKALEWFINLLMGRNHCRDAYDFMMREEKGWNE